MNEHIQSINKGVESKRRRRRLDLLVVIERTFTLLLLLLLLLCVYSWAEVGTHANERTHARMNSRRQRAEITDRWPCLPLLLALMSPQQQQQQLLTHTYPSP